MAVLRQMGEVDLKDLGIPMVLLARPRTLHTSIALQPPKQNDYLVDWS